MKSSNTTQPESLVNNPTHPCQFCAEPVPIDQDHCDRTCFTADEILRAFLDTTEDVCGEKVGV